MARLRGLCALALLLAAGLCRAAVPVEVDTAVTSHVLTPYVDVLEDKEGRLTVADVADPARSAAFRSAAAFGATTGNSEINFGYSGSAYWLRVNLARTASAPADQLLEVGFSSLDQVALYSRDGGGWQKQEAGDRVPFDARPVVHRNFVFPVHLAADGLTTVYLRIASDGTLTVPLRLWQVSAFDHHNQVAYSAFAFYFGMLLALALYNLFLFFSLRDRNYLIYVGMVAGMAVGQLSLSGLGNQFIWPEWPAWGNAALPAGFAISGFFGALFTRGFLGTAQTTPALDRLLVMFVWLFAVAALSPALLPYRWSAMLISLLGATFPFVAVASGIACQRRGHPAARYFLLAWTLLLIGVSVMGMRNLGWLPTNFFTLYVMLIGSSLDMLLLSFALADRINTERRAKEQAQAATLEAQHNLVKALQDSERELEGRIAERTRELSETNAQLRESEERFRSMANSAPVMIWLADANRQRTWFNKVWLDFTGGELAEELGTGWMQGIFPADLQRWLESYAAHFRGRRPYRMEYRLRHHDGEYRWVLDTGAPRFDEKGEFTGYIGSCIDITEKKWAEDMIWQQANYDSLTQLPNRRLFLDRLQQEIKKAQRSATSMALLFIDLDRFKEVNDKLGHEIGDVLLIEAASRISSCVRESDTVARLAGDEFTVIMPGLGDTGRVGQTAASIVRKLSEPFLIGDIEICISASVGIAIYPQDTQAPEELLRKADQAMYLAKTQGRNGYSHFQDAG